MKIITDLVKPKRKTLSPLCAYGKGLCSTRPNNLNKRSSSANDPPKGKTPSTLNYSDEYLHIAKVWKQQKIKKQILDDTPNISVNNSRPRFNKLNIQMLSENLHNQIFGNAKQTVSDEEINVAIAELQKHGIWKNEVDVVEDVHLKIPPLVGENIEEHFWNIGKQQSEPYKNLILSFISQGIPKQPENWLFQKGWTRYENGKAPEQVPYPNEDIVVLDTEVCVKFGALPTLATAVSKKAWYGWVSEDLYNSIKSPTATSYTTSKLIPFENDVNSLTPRVVVGHNVSYDRARIKEQYNFTQSAVRFVDTMSLHICIRGITRTQKIELKKSIDNVEFEPSKNSCLSSLKDVYNLYCEKELLKTKRCVFLEGTLEDIKADFQNLMMYCANDTNATYEVIQKVFPIFLERFPHPVTFAGMLEMGSAFLPVNENWKKFLIEADQTYEDLKNEMSLVLSKKSDFACRLFHNDVYKNDLWMWNEDWSTQTLKLTKKKVTKTSEVSSAATAAAAAAGTERNDDEEDLREKELTEKFQYLFDLEQILPKNKPFLPGYPLWYRKLCEKVDPSAQLTTSMMVTPKLLHLTWEGYPIYHTKDFGWGILVADVCASNDLNVRVPFEKIKDITLRNAKLDTSCLPRNLKSIVSMKTSNRLTPPFYYTGGGIWCNHTVDDCCYFYKLPHKDGDLFRVGNPLSKDFTQMLSGNFLAGSDYTAGKVIDLGIKMSYWRNNRERIINQMVVWLNRKEIPRNSQDGDNLVGVILPMVVVSGTLTRRALDSTWLTASRVEQNRIGSELRGFVQAPPGYHIVGADVDSQELWIASLIGDANASKIHGSTPLGWMTLSGTKAAGTDMHSVTAKAVGISRDHAKVINYARMYGAGVKFAQKLLQQYNLSMTDEESWEKALKMYALTKGVRFYTVKDSMRLEFVNRFGGAGQYDSKTAWKMVKTLGRPFDEVFDKSNWMNGTESSMFNELEKIATSLEPATPFLSSRLSQAVEPRFQGDYGNLSTRVNWVVQSGAVDFLHLMLVCMRWLTNGQARYSFSFHDEVRYLIPSDKRYDAALALHMTNLLVRSFCSHRLGIHDLPQSVAFFSSVEVDTVMRKEANDDCITPSNPHGIGKGYGIPPGESLTIYQAVEKTGGHLSAFKSTVSSFLLLFIQVMSKATKRKHVRMEALTGDLELPTENQQVVKVLGSRGNNLHEVESSDRSTFLVSMPNKFRKNIWIKKGDFILVEPIDEGEKVKAEMVKVLRSDYIKYLKKENVWPSEFVDDDKTHAEGPENSDDELFVNNNQDIVSDHSVHTTSEESE